MKRIGSNLRPADQKPHRNLRSIIRYSTSEKPDSVDAQLDAILGPYARKLAGHPLIAVAGNHDHYGDPLSTQNACAKIPALAPGWRYVSRGCDLDDQNPIAVLDAVKASGEVADADFA